MPDRADQSQPIVAVTRTLPGALTIPGAEIRVLGEKQPSACALNEFVAGASIIVSMFSDKIDAATLDAAGPGLKGICNFAVGHDNIDIDACRERGVTVANTPDTVTEGTADLAWLLVLAVARKLIAGDRFVRTGEWQTHGPLGMADFMGRDLTGRTLLIVGAGRIGYAVASRAKAWGMQILYTARSQHWNFELAPIAGRRVELDEGLARADVVSIHVPLTEQTHHLIDTRRLALMKPTAIIVNTARGPVIDEAALVRALEGNKIWGAGLDVFEREPEIHPGLIGLDNVTMTPHIGSAEIRFREAMTEMVAANASAILAGETPPNLVS